MNPDGRWMRRALALAARGWGRTRPNPMVGAVVVRNGRCVGEGWHPRAGEPHAEVFALRAAGDAAKGADLYVTLEPCCHHGRTPPCVNAVLGAGIRRVYAAMEDPFPRVAGGGFMALRTAGVETHCGLLEPAARSLNRAYLKATTRRMPWVTLKMASTLDGKIATRTGDSRWVTGPAARRQVHRLRDRHDAILTGIDTVLADNPLLTTRIPNGRDPVRIILDTRGRMPPDSAMVQTADEVATWWCVGKDLAPPDTLPARLKVVRCPMDERKGRVDLNYVLAEVLEAGLHSVLCEGGSAVAGSLLDAGLVDEVVWFLAPKLCGGTESLAALGGVGVERMSAAHRLREVRVRQFGSDWMLTGLLGSG